MTFSVIDSSTVCCTCASMTGVFSVLLRCWIHGFIVNINGNWGGYTLLTMRLTDSRLLQVVFIYQRMQISMYTLFSFDWSLLWRYCTRDDVFHVTTPPTLVVITWSTDAVACHEAIITLSVITFNLASRYLFCFPCILSQRVCNFWP